MIQKLSHRLATVAVAAAASVFSFSANAEIDNSSLSAPGFRQHVRTFGLVYTLPKEVNDTLDLATKGMLRRKAAQCEARGRGRTAQHPARHRRAHP